MTLSAIKGALLGVGICALTVGIGYVVYVYPVVLWVPAAAVAVGLIYCCTLIGKQEGW